MELVELVLMSGTLRAVFIKITLPGVQLSGVTQMNGKNDKRISHA